MRLMLGLDNGGGTTVYDDKKLSDYSRPSKVVGILLEAKAFHPTRTARNHLRVLAAAGGVSDNRVDEVLEMVGLKSESGKKPGKFSLGMSQRLGIAAAILGDPKYLILDEPANGLDPEGIAWLRDFLKDYADKGNAVFISSHLLGEMSQLADNVVVVGKGKLIADTSMKELIAGNRKSSIFVRVTNLPKLEHLLKLKGIKFEVSDSGLKISGAKTDDVGKFAFNAGLTVLELANHAASLEDTFLELTEGEAEFTGKTETAEKKGKLWRRR
jgi:ABC-2 type transport system ATP-binding protein